jgi:hypothetical protein
MREKTLRRLLAPAEVGVAAAAAVGAAGFAATTVFGRTALFWPSIHWAATFALALLAIGALWWLASRAAEGDGWRRWHGATWPFLALAPAAAAAVALYLDDRSNHLVANGESTKPELVTYLAALFVLGQVAYWLTIAGRHVRWPSRTAASAAPAALLLAIGIAVYANVSLYQRWPPFQIDFQVNLAAARELLAGHVPYRNDVPVWNDRVHQLPTTLVLLFGPLTLLSDSAAEVLFFFANQACWVAGAWLFIHRLVAREHRLYWVAGALLLGATYWPWQESINFGQPDGLLFLLWVWSITAVVAGRELPAGITLGLAFPVKPVSIWLPAIYLLHGRWRTLLVAGVMIAAVVLVTLPLTTWASWVTFVTVEVPAMLPGTVRGTNIPLASEYARFFVGREALGNGDPAPSYLIIRALDFGANVLALLLLAHLYVRPRERGAPAKTRAWLLDVCLGLVLTLLLAPYAWQHYASWLALAFLVLALPATWQPLDRVARVASAALAAAGFLLLSLDDSRLIDYLQPLVDRWPGVMAFYTAGLFCVAGALLVARLAPAPVQGSRFKVQSSDTGEIQHGAGVSDAGRLTASPAAVGATA